MSSEERRAQILAASIAVFGAKGYDGATTDDLAQAAGVSQAYVVRMFGSKQGLFLAAFEAVAQRLETDFRAALAEADATLPSGADAAQRIHARKEAMSVAYLRLLGERGLHLTMLQAFLRGGDPVIGPVARASFGRIWRFIREEAGFDAEFGKEFLSYGMLLNTLIGLRMLDSDGSGPADELLAMCFPDLDAVAGVVPRADERW
ncbi:AcrR family transcriptional regulator [Schumannella luteola]|uniref:AcrR family transcriptional regulator n=1 Tax=Schumannella luteola TaxID=472059 RepID=A0A852YFR8_9MICO|nr:TetR family transcriptional regulator [Schumannella luteola]NYG97908.1 AcrR family transcriptional regulator [Schumannella luteola]